MRTFSKVLAVVLCVAMLFTTAFASGLKVSFVDFQGNGNNITARVNLRNDGSANASGKVIVASYDANGNLVAEDLEVYPVMIDTFVIWKDKDGNPHALPDGQPRNISKNHVITLTTDRASEYSVYFKVANELYGAYNELRDQLAQEEYGKSYSELDGNQQEVCQQYFKMKIYEAKPQEYTVNVQQ